MRHISIDAVPKLAVMLLLEVHHSNLHADLRWSKVQLNGSSVNIMRGSFLNRRATRDFILLWQTNLLWSPPGHSCLCGQWWLLMKCSIWGPLQTKCSSSPSPVQLKSDCHGLPKWFPWALDVGVLFHFYWPGWKWLWKTLNQQRTMLLLVDTLACNPSNVDP